MADRVLIVDDDISVSTMLQKVVKSNGMAADIISSGQKALEHLKKQPYELILLEINLPDMNGFEVIQTIRNRGLKTPIIIVSTRKEDFDTIYGLDIGADDYITKPFNPIILGAKVKAIIRRSKGYLPGTNATIAAGPFTYNTTTLRFYKNGEEIFLSAKENTLMKLFMDNVNRVFSKDMIYSLVWGDAIIDENAVMVYMNRLRQKIEEDPATPKYLKTIRGLGYRFEISK